MPLNLAACSRGTRTLLRAGLWMAPVLGVAVALLVVGGTWRSTAARPSAASPMCERTPPWPRIVIVVFGMLLQELAFRVVDGWMGGWVDGGVTIPQTGPESMDGGSHCRRGARNCTGIIRPALCLFWRRAPCTFPHMLGDRDRRRPGTTNTPVRVLPCVVAGITAVAGTPQTRITRVRTMLNLWIRSAGQDSRGIRGKSIRRVGAARQLLYGALVLLPACGPAVRAGQAGSLPAAAAVPAAPAAEVSLEIDYAGAEAMMAALERDTLTDAAVDSLLAIHGVSMMVDNVVRLVPGVERADFRTAIQRFVRTGSVADEHVQFNLAKAHGEREHIRALLANIRADEQGVLERTLAVMAPYTPETGPLHLKAYLMAGGTSTGFVRNTPEGDVLYYNLADAAGDWEGAMSHITHEVFHLVQKAAYRRVPSLAAAADSAESLPLAHRTLATVIGEGTADLVSDPARFGGNGPEIARLRERFRGDAEPARVRANFALFDTTFQQVVRDEIGWREVLDRGFMSDPRFYALGFQMAKAIDRHCGPACIRRLLQEPPVEFFLEYIRLYRQHPEIVGRFAPETERALLSLR